MVVPSKDTIEKMLKKEKRDLLLIHGAWSSPTTFNYLREKLKGCKALGATTCVEYDTNTNSIRDIINVCNKFLDKSTNPVVVVGHSMGGIIAVNLHDHANVDSIVTVACPLSGLNINKFLQVLIAYRTPSISDIMHLSPFIMQTHSHEYTKPITCLITTKGYNPAWYEKSDGVVSVSSQKRWVPNSARIHEIPYNHHEVLQSEEFYEVVRDKVQRK